jgi:hypothetical protein
MSEQTIWKILLAIIALPVLIALGALYVIIPLMITIFILGSGL